MIQDDNNAYAYLQMMMQTCSRQRREYTKKEVEDSKKQVRDNI